MRRFLRVVSIAVFFIVVSSAYGITIFRLDEKGELSTVGLCSEHPSETNELYWWLGKSPNSIELRDPTGGVVSRWRAPKPLTTGHGRSIAASGCSISIINNDDPGEGFNDNTSVVPIGGNTATTLGAQRMAALQRAASIWADALSSDVPIVIEASFDPLQCDEYGVVGGGAIPVSVDRDFAGAPLVNTWYVQAEANALAGADLLPDYADIVIVLNSSLDDNCLPGYQWYYGFDKGGGEYEIDFLSVCLHEICHGLGFIELLGEDGAKYDGYDDVFVTFLRDVSEGKQWSEMSNAERALSSVDTNDLVWTGHNVNDAAISMLASGRHATSGQVMMFAPSTFMPSSSVSHFTDLCSPNQLMEPSIVEAIHELDLSLQLLYDIGWSAPVAEATPTETSSVGYWKSFQ